MKFLGSLFICLFVLSAPLIQAPKDVDDAITYLDSFEDNSLEKQTLSAFTSFKKGTAVEKHENLVLFPLLMQGLNPKAKFHLENLFKHMRAELEPSAGTPRGRGRMPQGGVPVRAIHPAAPARNHDEEYAYQVAREEASKAAQPYVFASAPSLSSKAPFSTGRSTSPARHTKPPPVFGRTWYSFERPEASPSDLDEKRKQIEADEALARQLAAQELSPRSGRSVPVRGRSSSPSTRVRSTVPVADTDVSPRAYTSRMPLSSGRISKTAADFFVYYFQDYVESTSRCAYTSDRLRAPWNNGDVVTLESIIGRPDADGMTMTGGLNFDEAEECHCWIQWAFPSQNPSRFNNQAPLSSATIQASFKRNQRLMGALKNSFKFYLNFMGLNLDETVDGIISFRERANFAARIKNILDHPHNFARISRIISSLMEHGLEKYAQAFAIYLTTELPTKNTRFRTKTSSSWSYWKDNAGFTTPSAAASKSRPPSPQRHLTPPDISRKEALARGTAAKDSRKYAGGGSGLRMRSPSPDEPDTSGDAELARALEASDRRSTPMRRSPSPEARSSGRRVVTDDEPSSRGRSSPERRYGRSSSVSALDRPSYESESRIAATRRAAVNARIMANPRSFVVTPLPCASQSGVDCGYHGSANGTTLAQHTQQRGTFKGVAFEPQGMISRMKEDFLRSGRLVDAETRSSALAYGNVEAFTRFLLTKTEQRTIYQNTQNPLLYFTPLDYLQNTMECEKINTAQTLVRFIEASDKNFQLIRKTVERRYRNYTGDLVFPNSEGDDRLIDISAGEGITMAMLKDTLSLLTETKRSLKHALSGRYDLIHPKPLIDAIQAFRAGKKLIITWLIHSGGGIGHWICLGFEQGRDDRINVYKINSSDSRGSFPELDEDAKRFIYDLKTFEIPKFEENASLRDLFA